jgi:hypothetical protein
MHGQPRCVIFFILSVCCFDALCLSFNLCLQIHVCFKYELVNFWFLNLSLELLLDGRFKSSDDNSKYMCLMPLSTIFHLYHEKPDWAQITSNCIKNYSPWSGIKIHKLFVEKHGSQIAANGDLWYKLDLRN